MSRSEDSDRLKVKRFAHLLPEKPCRLGGLVNTAGTGAEASDASLFETSLEQTKGGIEAEMWLIDLSLQ